LSLDGGFVATGNQDGTITLHDNDTGQLIGETLRHNTPFLGNVTSVAYSPDGRYLATAGNDGAVVIRDATSHEVIGEPMLGHYAVVVSLAFSPDSQWLASGSCSQFHSAGSCIGGEIIIWDVASHEPLQRITGTVGFNQALAFSPDGKTIVTNDCPRIEVAGACIEGALKLWDIASGEFLTKTFDGHTGLIWSATFNPDGTILASGSADNTIIIWDVESGTPIGQRQANHGGPVRRVAFSPDGSRLASAGLDNLVYLWDVESGQAIGGPVVVYGNNAMDVAFSLDGKTLASSSVDGTVTLTDVDLDSWRARACRIANRNMRPTEWELFFDELPYQETCPEEQ
jgi:WD40 repeat protein